MICDSVKVSTYDDYWTARGTQLAEGRERERGGEEGGREGEKMT